MTSRVTVRVPPELVESARALQYANRKRLAARELASRVTETVRQQVDAARQSSPLPDNLIGGQLEFAKKKRWKIETRRRRLRPGFLLIPSADYDNQLRLPVLTDYGGQEYATTQYDAPFELIEGRLMAKLSSVVNQEQTGQSFFSSLIYETTSIEETSPIFTFEFFVSLEAGPAQQPLLENLGDGSQRLTEYGADFYFSVSGALSQALLINLSKTAIYSVNSQFFPTGSGLRQSWGLNINGIRNQDILLTTGGGEYHVAMVQSNQVIRIYFDGNIVRTYDGIEGIPAEQALVSGFQASAGKGVRRFGQEFGSIISETFYAEGPKSGFRCFRFTPGQALYSGNSFTPPTSITDLA